MAIDFISSVDNNEEGVMHSKSENIEKIINDEADEDKKLFKLLKNKYQNNLELRKGSEFIFYYVLSLYYKYHKVNLTCGGSYIDSPISIKQKCNNSAYQQKS